MTIVAAAVRRGSSDAGVLPGNRVDYGSCSPLCRLSLTTRQQFRPRHYVVLATLSQRRFRRSPTFSAPMRRQLASSSHGRCNRSGCCAHSAMLWVRIQGVALRALAAFMHTQSPRKGPDPAVQPMPRTASLCCPKSARLAKHCAVPLASSCLRTALGLFNGFRWRPCQHSEFYCTRAVRCLPLALRLQPTRSSRLPSGDCSVHLHKKVLALSDIQVRWQRKHGYQ